MDKRLLEDFDTADDDSMYGRSHVEQNAFTRSKLKYWVMTCVIQTSIFVVLAFVFSSTMFQVQQGKSLVLPQVMQSENSELYQHGFPAMFSNLIQYRMEESSHDSWNPSLFFGPPSDDSERAWNTLITPRSLKLHPDEAARVSITDSIRVKPDNEFAAILGVKHNLHCLRMIRQMMYPDHYYAHAPQDLLDHNREHAFHCLESIRKSVLCYPDLNPRHYFYSGNKYHNTTPSAQVTQQCVDWTLVERDLDRRYLVWEDLIPSTGPAY